ncbi:peptide ABC transporter substrate-binding protein [Candidatus Saccharibacteria bacterium]|nr:peptide ABC transporter substrate-binding protein [Candidatus Saccharibacteria bacterium]
MKKQLKKSGQKIFKRLSRAGRQASEASKIHVKENLFARVDSVKHVRLWILEWILLVSAIILFAIVQMIWYQNSYQTSAFVQGGTYTEATLGKINSMNPLYATTSSEKTLARLLFPGLLSVDVSGNLGNNLAESVTIDSTKKVWTVKLRDDLRWSDGNPLTADDVVFSFKLINNPAAKTSISTGFANTKIEQINNLTVQFTLPTTYVAFYDALVFPIVPAHILSGVEPALIYEHNFSSNPVSSGPFMLNAVQPSTYGETIYLNKNPNYYRGETMLNSFVLKTFSSSDDIVTALNRLDVTASADLSNVSNPNITNSNIFTKKTATNNGAFAFLNTLSPALLNKNVRQALRYGIDIEALRENLVSDMPLDFPILSNQIDISFPELPAYDKDKALALLSEAGYTFEEGKLTDNTGEQPALNIVTVSSGHLAELAKRLSAQLTELGFDAKTNIYETESSSHNFFTSIIRPRDYDILLYEIDMGTDPDLFPYYHSSQASASGFNFSDYKNGLVDDLLLSARTTFDLSLRKAKYESFLDHWIDDVPAIGLYQINLTYYFNHSARTFSENSRLSSSFDRFSDIQYWATEKGTRYRTP